MAKLIKGYKDKFTIVDNEIFKDDRLSYKDLGLLCQLLSLPDKWSFSVKGLAKLHKDGKASIITGVENLERCGYLTRKQSRGDSGFFSGYDYLIYQDPSDNPDYDPQENPPMDEPHDDLRPSENPMDADSAAEETDKEIPIADKRFTENRKTDKRESDSPSIGNRFADNQPQYSTKECNTQESSTKQSITDLLRMYGSESGAEANNYSEDEIMDWDDEEFYEHLNSGESEAFVRLLKASAKGEIISCKSSLIDYFKKMMAKGWKDSSGRRIRNIEGYVRSNFGLYAENQRYRRKQMEDI